MTNNLSSAIQCVGRFFQTRTYVTFDNDNSLKDVHLNFAQQIFRRLGFYQETHLKNVVGKAYRLTFSEKKGQNIQTQKNKIFDVINKAELVYRNNPLYEELQEITLDDGKKVKVSGRYNLQTTTGSIEIKLSLNGAERILSFFKMPAHEVHTWIDGRCFIDKNQERLNRTTLALVPNILKASATINQLYFTIAKNTSEGVLGNEKVQSEIMPFGWNYEKNLQWHVLMCQYIQKKNEPIPEENRLSNVAGISLDFGLEFVASTEPAIVIHNGKKNE